MESFAITCMFVSYYFPFYSTILNNLQYDARVVLQIFIKPDSYQVGKETLGGRVSDPLFPDSELDWSTERKESTIICGLLVSLEATDTKGTVSSKVFSWVFHKFS